MDNINKTHNEEYHHFYQVGTDESGDTVAIFIKNTAHHQGLTCLKSIIRN